MGCIEAVIFYNRATAVVSVASLEYWTFRSRKEKEGCYAAMNRLA